MVTQENIAHTILLIPSNYIRPTVYQCSYFQPKIGVSALDRQYYGRKSETSQVRQRFSILLWSNWDSLFLVLYLKRGELAAIQLHTQKTAVNGSATYSHCKHSLSVPEYMLPGTCDRGSVVGPWQQGPWSVVWLDNYICPLHKKLCRVTF